MSFTCFGFHTWAPNQFYQLRQKDGAESAFLIDMSMGSENVYEVKRSQRHFLSPN